MIDRIVFNSHRIVLTKNSRVKLSHDPNNTKWTRDTRGFGHKILTVQGWQPGELLGAKDAPHAEYHTAANASHIRVFVKDDNLGLGAKRGSGLAEGECTGLDVFQTLLGRLNGKDEDVLAKEQKSREDLKRAIFTERRWGSIRFVRGGYLVGDKIQELVDIEETRVRKIAPKREESSGTTTDTDATKDSTEALLKSKKKKRKSEKRREISDGSNTVTLMKPTEDTLGQVSIQDDDQEVVNTKEKSSKKKRKREVGISAEELSARELRKDKKRKSKEKRSKVAAEVVQVAEQVAIETTGPSHTSGSPTPTLHTGSSTPQSLGGRHAVRSRNIAQKRLAVLDITSLNQVSIKSSLLIIGY